MWLKFGLQITQPALPTYITDGSKGVRMGDLDPMEEGERAAANGEPLSANPYPEGSEAHEAWAHGWRHYHSENENGEPLEGA